VRAAEVLRHGWMPLADRLLVSPPSPSRAKPEFYIQEGSTLLPWCAEVSMRPLLAVLVLVRLAAAVVQAQAPIIVGPNG
jgi:hypothetical protein